VRCVNQFTCGSRRRRYCTSGDSSPIPRLHTGNRRLRATWVYGQAPPPGWTTSFDFESWLNYPACLIGAPDFFARR